MCTFHQTAFIIYLFIRCCVDKQWQFIVCVACGICNQTGAFHFLYCMRPFRYFSPSLPLIFSLWVFQWFSGGFCLLITHPKSVFIVVFFMIVIGFLFWVILELFWKFSHLFFWLLRILHHSSEPCLYHLHFLFHLSVYRLNLTSIA